MSSAKKRKTIIKTLREAYGDRCHWCGGLMTFHKYGTHDPMTKDRVTIEHHIAKQKGDINQILYMRLSHFGCNL